MRKFVLLVCLLIAIAIAGCASEQGSSRGPSGNSGNSSRGGCH